MKAAKPRTAFARFEDFARRIIAVPKAEVAKQEATYKKGRARKRKLALAR